MVQRFISTLGILVLVALPLLGQAQERKTYSCSSSKAREGTARVGSAGSAKTMGTVETERETTIRFLPCDVPEGISMPQFEGSARDGFDAVLATVNKDLKKKKQLTIRVDPSLNEALTTRKARYAPGGYRVEDLLNNLCGGKCDWQFEEQEESRVLVVSPRPATAAP
jgi:hypothetical protein